MRLSGRRRGAKPSYIPTIAAAELYYLFEKKGWRRYWSRFRAEMARAETFRYYPFNERILNLFHNTRAKEIHDKIIVLTAKVLGADALITKGQDLVRLGEVKTLWE